MLHIILIESIFFIVLLAICLYYKKKPILKAQRTITEILGSPIDSRKRDFLLEYVNKKYICNDIERYVQSLIDAEIEEMFKTGSFLQERRHNITNILDKLGTKLSQEHVQKIYKLKRKIIGEKIGEFEQKSCLSKWHIDEFNRLFIELETVLTKDEIDRLEMLKEKLIDDKLKEFEDDLFENYAEIQNRMKYLYHLAIELEINLTDIQLNEINKIEKYAMVLKGNYEPIIINYQLGKENVFYSTPAGLYGRKQKLRKVDDGNLYLTNKRIVYFGNSGKNRSIALDKIIAVELLEYDGCRVGIEIKNQTRKNTIFLFDDDPKLFWLLIYMLGKTQKYKSSGEKTSSKRQADWNTGERTSFKGQSDYDIGIQFCYELLGISNSATKEEVLSAYREKAKKFHPDVGGDKGDNNIFPTLTDAKYKILKHMG